MLGSTSILKAISSNLLPCKLNGSSPIRPIYNFLNKAWYSSSTSTSSIHEPHEIPEHVRYVEDSPDPSFFHMVEYFYHRGWQVVEDKLVEEWKSKLSEDEKRRRVRGYLNIIGPCHAVIEVCFPLKRDNGSWVMINGWRAQHSHHRMPCKGGNVGPQSNDITNQLS